MHVMFLWKYKEKHIFCGYKILTKDVWVMADCCSMIDTCCCRMKRVVWFIMLKNITKSNNVSTSYIPVSVQYFNGEIETKLNQDGVTGAVTILWALWSWVWFLTVARDSFPVQNVQTSCGSHPASYSLVTRGPSLEIMQPGSVADHLYPSFAKVKNAFNCTYTPLVFLHGICKDNVTFIIISIEPERVSFAFLPY